MMQAGHPDANLLAGFADGLLAESEREILLDHLSVCRYCRECVSLAAEPAVVRRAGRWSDSRRLWVGFAAAVIACFLTASLWREYSSAAPETQHSASEATRKSLGSRRRFQHLRLTRPGESPAAINLIAHLVRRKPRQNQLIVVGPYGERWLTLETSWSLPEIRPESPGTVN